MAVSAACNDYLIETAKNLKGSAERTASLMEEMHACNDYLTACNDLLKLHAMKGSAERTASLMEEEMEAATSARQKA